MERSRLDKPSDLPIVAASMEQPTVRLCLRVQRGGACFGSDKDHCGGRRFTAAPVGEEIVLSGAEDATAVRPTLTGEGLRL